MPLLSPLAGIGVFLRIQSGRNCVIQTIAPGLGRLSMASKVTRFSQRSPVTRITGYSFLLPVVDTTTTLTLSDPTAPIGHRPSKRTTRTTRTAWASIQATSSGTTATGMTAGQFVLSQNKLRVALPSAVTKRQIVGMQGVSQASPINLSESLVHLLAVKSGKGGQYSCVLQLLNCGRSTIFINFAV